MGMKVWFDFEFMDVPRTAIAPPHLEALSLGGIREDGVLFYAQFSDVDTSKASQWVKDNVLPYLTHAAPVTRAMGAELFLAFVGPSPEFWGYYPSYDWVLLSQLYGTLVERPEGWPMRPNCVMQLADDNGIPLNTDILPATHEHHALYDAIWVRDAEVYVRAQIAEKALAC